VPEIPTVTGPVRSIKARQRVNARSESQNGAAASAPANGNGKSNGHTSPDTPSNGHTSPDEQSNGNGSAPTRDLRLHLPRTADLTADTRRMQDLHELLRTYEGDDQVTLYMQRGSELVVLRPYYTVHASHALLDELADVLGHESVDLVALE
jgi:DNA polymerase-3 subunit alpha